MFVFNDVNSTNLPTCVTDDQNPVRHEPTYKRKNVKIQINLLKTVKTKLQGDTGANTSTTNQLKLLHDYWPFKTTESVGVYLQNNDSSEVCYNIRNIRHWIYIYIYIYISYLWSRNNDALGNSLYFTWLRHCIISWQLYS